MTVVVGTHFLPHVWLNNARIYLPLAVILSVGALVLVVVYKADSRLIIPFATGGVLIFGALVLTEQWMMTKR